jgi:predicted transcriptional regulator of viral defense system
MKSKAIQHQPRNYLEDYLFKIQSYGRYSFTLPELKTQFNQSEKAILQSLFRLKKTGKVAQIRKSFYVIVPPEYAATGTLPPVLFINDLMKFLKRDYYVSLQSAAALHGAAHQQPQEFFVIIEKPSLRKISTEKLKLNFIVKNRLPLNCIENKKSDTGFFNISSPELTALDIVQYQLKTGGLNNVVTILQELAEVITPSKISNCVDNSIATTTLQRLGYIFDKVLHNQKFSNAIENILKSKNKSPVLLKIKGKRQGFPINKKWMIIENVKLESDL